MWISIGQATDNSSSEHLTTKIYFLLTSKWASGFPLLYIIESSCFHLATLPLEILCLLLCRWQRSLKTYPGYLNSHRLKVTDIPWINVLLLSHNSNLTAPQRTLENAGEHMRCLISTNNLFQKRWMSMTKIIEGAHVRFIMTTQVF